MAQEWGKVNLYKDFADYNLERIKKAGYKCSEDWKGDLYYGITLDWHYEEGYLDISMPGYVERLLLKFKHKKPAKPQHNPFRAPPKVYGAAAQDPIPEDRPSGWTQKASKEA